MEGDLSKVVPHGKAPKLSSELPNLMDTGELGQRSVFGCTLRQWICLR